MNCEISRLTLKKISGSFYRLTISSGPWSFPVLSDANLGTINSMLSHALKCLNADMLNIPRPLLDQSHITPSNIDLNEYEIRPLTVWPYTRQLYMRWNQYTFTANIEPSLEALIAAYSAAARFFAIKSGVVVMDEDFDVRNVQRASEDGYRWIGQEKREE